MRRIFKPGDRVRFKNESPVMTVQKYAREYSRWIGWYESNVIVECTWFDAEGYQRRNFHQNNLIKVSPNRINKDMVNKGSLSKKQSQA